MRDVTFLRLLADRLNPEEIVELLGLSTQELVLFYRDEILARKEELMWLVDFEEFRDE